jgi:hypothetical protein
MLLVSRPSLRKRLDSPPFVKNVEDYFTVTFPMEDSRRETITYGINFGDRPTFYFIGWPPFASKKRPYTVISNPGPSP